MKKLIKNSKLIIIVLTLCCCSLFVNAQTTILPLNSYGVWDRSNAFDISVNTDYNYLRGISADVNWEDVQALDSIQYDWSGIQAVLQAASNNNQMVNVSIGVGPDAPAWVYANGVPGVITDDTAHPNWTQYPYYLDSDYKRYYFKMIASFGNFLRSQPANLFSHIAYVQVKTGCTGDEVAYKGTPLNASYTISSTAWRTFRLEAFEKFRLAFNTGNNNTQIGLLFNNIDPIDEPSEWQWVNNNVTYGFGTKGGAYARGHHLSDELDFKNTWTPYLINPQGLKLFSAAEMDQTWTKPYYQLNVPLGFYWGALSGLNTGLSVWLVTQSALQEAQAKPELHAVFKMFNKYANQIYPSTANAAYSIFHEGLNSKNTTKFPVSIYGAANQSNQARYIAICNAYASRGAKMDHVFAATKGQVWQRDNQTGYNDAGWIIEEGNYERGITQINPDATSIGLFRVRGTLNASSSIYDRFARSFQNSSGKNSMYFKFHQDMFTTAAPDSLTFKIIWLDKTSNSTWAFKYYNSAGLQTALSVTGIGDNQWKTINVVLHNPVINQGGILGSDFMLVNTDGIDDIFHGIEVDITRKVGVKVCPKVFLNNLNTTTALMPNDLTALSNFPLADPYANAPMNSVFTHVNNPTIATTTPAVLATTGNNAIVDWLFLELRTGTSGSTSVAYTKAALLQRNGNVVATDGISPVEFSTASAGNYHVCIRHRNSLGFRTANTVALTSTTTVLNFTNNTIPLFGATPLVALAQNVYGLISGDANSDGSIDAFDSILWEMQNGLFDDYSKNSDYNLDGSIDAIDSILWELNNGKFETLD